MAILEDLISSGELKGKTICYYPGSFDPPHKGHEYIAREVVRRGFCDFSLAFAVWGDDRYKKRTDTKCRIEMLFSLFANDPNVIVTERNPIQLQNALAECGAKFVGLIGSDAALFYASREKDLREFMSGIRIDENDGRNDVSRGDVFIPADSFVVSDRKGFDFPPDKMPDGRKIIGRLDTSETYPISSEEIRKAIRAGGDSKSVLSGSVVELVNRYGLYRL
jgi:nicotinic acid mononucleotide adenylyltransferase